MLGIAFVCFLCELCWELCLSVCLLGHLCLELVVSYGTSTADCFWNIWQS